MTPQGRRLITNHRKNYPRHPDSDGFIYQLFLVDLQLATLNEFGHFPARSQFVPRDRQTRDQKKTEQEAMQYGLCYGSPFFDLALAHAQWAEKSEGNTELARREQGWRDGNLKLAAAKAFSGGLSKKK